MEADGKKAFATTKIDYLSADDEDRVMIAQSNEKLGKKNELLNKHGRTRKQIERKKRKK